MKIILFGKNGQLAKEFILNLKENLDLIIIGSEEIDFSDKLKLRHAIENIKPNFIINTAAFTKVDLAEKKTDEAFAINSEALSVIASSCKKVNAKLIHFSTDYVFNGKSNRPYYEDDFTDPLNIYGMSKLKGELNIINSGCDFFIVRISWLMSKYDSNFIHTVVSRLKRGDNLRIINDQFGAPTSTSLIVDITEKLILKNNLLSKEIFHVSPKGKVSWYDLVMHIANKMLLDGGNINKNQISPITSQEYYSMAKRPSNSCLNHSKIEKALNVLLPYWHKDIDEIINFHIQNT